MGKQDMPRNASLNDPNQKQNRVPSETESMTLRTIRSRQRQLAETLKRELDTAKEEHERIQIRHDQLLRELEAAQSELSFSQGYLNNLENQLTALQEEDGRLTGLLHPIRRCPEDVIKLIFDHIIEENFSIKVATAASHVCRSWRAIALGTKWLWTRFNINMDDNPDDVRLFMERTKARVRQAPITIAITGIRRGPADVMTQIIQSLKLGQFAKIATLDLMLSEAADFLTLTHPAFRFVGVLVDNLIIRTEFVSLNRQTWDFTPLLCKFPNLTSLELIDLGTVMLSGDMSFPSLQKLYFTNVEMHTLSLELFRLPRLQELGVSGCQFDMEPLLDDIYLPELWYLSINMPRGFPWDRISAPKLEEMLTDDDSNDAAEFICRHSSITFLKYTTPITESRFKDFASNLFSLESLSIVGPFVRLLKSSNPSIISLPFPKLETLAMDDSAASELSLEDFEWLVSTRCISQKEADGKENHRISTLMIHMKTENLDTVVWRRSSFFAEIRETVEMSTRNELNSFITLKMLE